MSHRFEHEFSHGRVAVFHDGLSLDVVRNTTRVTIAVESDDERYFPSARYESIPLLPLVAFVAELVQSKKISDLEQAEVLDILRGLR